MLDFPPQAFARLLDEVLARAPRADSLIHGQAHWRGVTFAALELAPHVPGSDSLVGFLFGLIHDSQRLDDGADPLHGPRAALFAQHLFDQSLLPVDAAQLRLLIDACHGHTTGRSSADPTVGLCWDADRLNLWRIGVRPRPEFLSTPAARAPAMIQAHQRLPGERATWTELHERWAAA